MGRIGIPILVGVIALFAVERPAPSPGEGGRGLAWAVATLAALPLLTLAIGVVARRRMAECPALRRRWLPCVRVLLSSAEVALVGLFVWHVFRDHLPGVLAVWLFWLPLPNVRRLVVLLPLIAGVLVVRLALYESQRQSEASYVAYTGFQLRCTLLPVAPILAYLLLDDLFAFAPVDVRLFAVSHPALGYLALFLLVVGAFVHAPTLLRRLWPSEPLEHPDLQARVRAIADRHGIAYGRIAVWMTRGVRFFNAAVAGILPRRRELYVTDALLHAMDVDEVEGVLAHELGHLRHRHLWLYMAYSFIYFGAYLLVFGTIGKWLPSSVAASPWASAVLIMGFLYLYFVILLGLFSRRWEHQADLFAVQNMRVPEAYGRALEKLAEMHALPLHVRRFFDWNKTHPSIGRRVEFVRRSLAGDPSVLRYGRPLWVSWALVAAVPVLSVGLIVHRAGLFGSEVEILQRRATLLLEDVEGQLADAPSGGAARLPRAIRLRVGDLNGRAREDIERALALAPGDVHTRYLRAWTDVFAERWLAAEQAFGEVLDASPDHAGALYGAALVQAEQGRWQEARQLIARASAAEPNDPQIARLRRRIAAHAGTNADGNGGAREE